MSAPKLVVKTEGGESSPSGSRRKGSSSGGKKKKGAEDESLLDDSLDPVEKMLTYVSSPTVLVRVRLVREVSCFNIIFFVLFFPSHHESLGCCFFL